MTVAPLKLFISHAAEDSELADRLIGLMNAAFGLQTEQIRCTCLPGYGLPAGVNFNEHLRREVLESVVFIGIISHASLASTYVLLEFGARWGTGNILIPLVAHGVSMSVVGSPLSELHAVCADDAEQLHRLISDLETPFEMLSRKAAVYERDLQKVLRVPATGPARTPAAAGADLVATELRATEELKVGVGKTKIHDRTDLTVTLLDTLESSGSAKLRIALPGQDVSETYAVSGRIWRFTANGDRYRMVLTEIDYKNKTVTLDIRKDPARS